MKGSIILKGDSLNIRKQPNMDSDIVGSLGFGEEVDVLETIESFYRIDRGYISKDYVILNQHKTNGDWKNGLQSIEGFRFTKGYEGFSQNSYIDAGGYQTIGYGITQKYQPELYAHLMKNNSEELAAKVSLWLKIQNYGKPIVEACKSLGVTKQYQFDALLDLAFNSGNSFVTRDNELTRAIKRDINDENYIREVWERTRVTSNGKYLEGLKLRRIAECNIFFNKGYEKRAICNVVNGKITGNIGGDGWNYTVEASNIGRVNFSSGLPLRKEKRYAADEIYFLIPNGREVKIIEAVGNWYLVEYLGYKGFVSKAYIII